MLLHLVAWTCTLLWSLSDGAAITEREAPTTISAIPISGSSTEVGWVPIDDEEVITTTPRSTTSDESYSTTSFKEAKIQYSPFSALGRNNNDDAQSAMVDIELPFENNTHIITWLAPNDENLNNDDDESEHQPSKRDTASSFQNEPKCGGLFTGFGGVIKSPGYPLFYPNNKKCEYKITLPANYTIKLSCDDFHMQGGGGNSCDHDHIDIQWTDGENNITSSKFCGIEPPSISSKSNEMSLTFKSDALYRYKGFVCRYRAIQPNGIAAPNSFDYGDNSITDDDDGAKAIYPSDFFNMPGCHDQALSANVATSSSGSSGSGSASTYSGGLWSGSCGSSNFFDSPQNRIVGGLETSPHQYPWMVSILRACGNEFCHVCGGTIISPAWILTSAHCLSSVPIEQMGVLLGDHNLFELNYEQKFLRGVDKIIHPDFNEPSILNNDIGLLRLENEISFTKFISPLCLPPLGETGFGTSAYGNENSTTLDTTGLGIVGNNATVIGWGMINDKGQYPNGLHEVEVQILDNSVCSDLYGPFITENMMCTSGTNGRGSCYGDSGGPALVKDVDGSFVQVGIVSFGANEGCEDGYPSGQVLVHKFIDWIQHVTGIHI